MDISSREMQELYLEVEALSRAKVERSEQHYQLLFETTPVPTLETDFRDALAWLRQLDPVDPAARLADDESLLTHAISLVEIVDCNQAAARLWRLPSRQLLLGRVNPESPINKESGAAWLRQFEAILTGTRSISFEFEALRADSEPYSALCQWTAPMIDGVVDYSAVLVVIIDITERIAAEAQMRQLVASKDDFLAAVSHELRTPLTSVLGYADLVRATPDLDPADRNAMLTTITEQASDLANIVEDLLIGARADMGQIIVDEQPVELGAAVAETVAGLRTSRPYALEGAELNPVVVGDASRVRQILRNLLTNVDRYGGPECSIRIGSDDVNAWIAVCDNGAALPTETVDRLFDRYYRERPDPGQPGSVGIGLTISRELARLMKGDLTYRHEDGWKVFELSLPLARTPVGVPS